MVKSQFDKLVASLSTEERKEMLRKIEETFSLSAEPLSLPEPEVKEEEVDPIEYYYKSDLLTKIYVFLVSIFTGKDKGDVVLQTFIGRLKRKIGRDYATYFRMEKKQGLPPFYHLLVNMNNAFEVYREPLFMAMKEKEDFFVFLTNRVLGKREEEIYRDTDPYFVEKQHPEYTVNQIHREIDDNYERIVKSLDEEKRRKLVLHSIIIRQLHSLAQFDFRKLLKPFAVNLEGETGYVDLDRIKSSLLSLNDVLSSLRQPPDITLLEALFIYEYRTELAEDTVENLEEKLHSHIGAAVEGLNCIRDFNKKIPLTDLLRVLTENINYQPQAVSGGEGALHHYKAYLKAAIAERFRHFVNDKKKRDLVKTLGATWSMNYIEPLMGYRAASFQLPGPFTYEASLSALAVFINKIVQEKYYNPLNMVQINGDFYRRDNRTEFTETYDRLQQIPSRLRNFSLSFLIEGTYYNRLHDAIREEGTRDAREERISNVRKLADREAKGIIKESMEVISSLSSLLKGIIMGTGGAYDTLSNYSELGGTRNREFKNDLISLEFLVSNFHKTLLDVISIEEKGATGN